MAQWQYTKGLHDIGNGLYAPTCCPTAAGGGATRV